MSYWMLSPEPQKKKKKKKKKLYAFQLTTPGKGVLEKTKIRFNVYALRAIVKSVFIALAKSESAC